MKNFTANKKPWLTLLGLGFFFIFLSYIPPFSVFYISPLIIAIIFGVLFSNFLPKHIEILKQSSVSDIATKQILRLGIILFGFRISFDDIVFVGFNGIFLAFFMVFSTFFIGMFLGKILGLETKLSALISSGTAVCGAAAVLASDSVIKGGVNRVAVALCMVVIFGTIGMFLYPFLLHFLGFNEISAGYFIGASLHEVAHVVGASSAISESAQKYAVIIKMIRVIMLVLLLFMLKILNVNDKKDIKFKDFIPHFALWFLAMICLNSLLNLPDFAIKFINFIVALLLCMAMFCLGLGINKNIFKSVGFKPFVMAGVLFLYMIIGCILCIKFL